MKRFLPDRIGDFIRHESAGGILLVVVAILALIIDNSTLAWAYDAFLNAPVSVRVGALAIDKPLLLWVNDGLMTIFFLLVGLELKRELLEGELATWQQAALPAIAAIGGMIVPAIIYAAFNFGDATAMRGWAIPTATDIAFAMGVLALLGDRVPPALKVFLLALAIIDDLGAILIIAAFYTEKLSPLALGLAVPGIIGLIALNRLGVQQRAAYLLLGLALWVCVLKSGVHATLAGVATAFAIPLRAGERDGDSPLLELEHALHPWVAFAILPVFAFANAGVSLGGLSLALLLHPVTLGIALGLFLGKQLGVLAATWLAIRCGLGRLPEGTNWQQIYGAALVAGIGFTMSLFIGTLAFHGPDEAAYLRLGVLAGSFASAIAGYAVLRLAAARPVPDARVANAD